METYMCVVLGRNNGVVYIKRGDGDFYTEHGTRVEWVQRAIEHRPDDWQILFDGHQDLAPDYQ